MKTETLIALKKSLFDICHQQIQERIKTVRESLSLSEDSKDAETKSSAGDKHETSRAMMQLEMERNHKQLIQNLDLEKELLQITIDKKTKKATKGSLVISNTGNYFIAIGLGKIEYQDQIYYVISPKSPFGSMLLNKEKGHTFYFGEKENKIEEVY